MKHVMLPVLSAGLASVCAATFAFAQVVPNVQGGQTAQLEHVPVSGLYMGPPSALKNPDAGNRQAWLEGKKLFSAMNCAGCHAPGGGGGMGPPLSVPADEWIYGKSPGDIYLTILHGRPNGMPQWGTRLPPQAIWALVTYVESLSKPNPEFKVSTALGVQKKPGNTPHPRGKIEPPPNPKQPVPGTHNPAHAPASSESAQPPPSSGSSRP